MTRSSVVLRPVMRALRRAQAQPPRSRGLKLRVEALEDRAVPAAFVVDTLDYPFPRDGTGVTLWEAVERANRTVGPDTIVFADSLAGGTIHLSNFVFPSSQLPTIFTDVTIVGLGADRLTIDADGGSRIFEIADSATVEICGLTLTGGNARSGSESSYSGGAILNRGTLAVTGATLSGNAAEDGGAVLNLGTLTVVGSTISGNSATRAGGGIANHGMLSVIASTLSGNTADTGVPPVTPAGGGGIFNFADGLLTVTGSTLSGNSTDRAGGGVANHGRLSVVNSTLSGNSALREGRSSPTRPRTA